jgi:rod shape-determining protein MreC
MVRTLGSAWLAALVAAGIALIALAPLPIASRLEAGGAALAAPAVQALRGLARPAAEVVLHAGQLRRLAHDNARLQQDVARLEAEAAALRQAVSAYDAGAALAAAVGDAPGHLQAAVTVRDPAPGRRQLLIDRGATDGVVVGQPVLGPSATLVGIVVEVQPRRARVRLLADAASTVAAVGQQSRTPGALVGGADGLRLEFVPLGAPLAVGELVVSSPLGGMLPPGLLIGRVAAVRGRPHDLFAAVAIEPLVDDARLEQVLVVTGFLPAEATP